MKRYLLLIYYSKYELIHNSSNNTINTDYNTSILILLYSWYGPEQQ